MIREVFANFSTLIVFAHVLSAIIWIGGMVAIRFAIHPSMQNITEPKIKLARTLENLKRFFNIVIPFIVILVLTAMILAIALGFKGTSLYPIVHVKEAIWTVMTIIFIVIYRKRNKAQRAFISGDLATAKDILAPIAKYYIPANITLGIFALYFGVVLRGF